MRISVGAGTYVVAVSGGVDSMVLLDVLRQRPGVKLVVAHFDHGIRPDSHLDRKHVQATARRHDLNFVHHEGKLGAKANEAIARQARYEFLNQVKEATGAKAIITAHHQDDVLETALMNIIRGSGRRGLTSLRSTDGMVRPLLEYDKTEIHDYAQRHNIAWREDSTNTDTRHLRNHIRHHVIPKLTPGKRAQLTILLSELHDTNDLLDAHVVNLLHTQNTVNSISRRWFVALPHDIAREVVYGWLRQHSVPNITRPTVERLVIAMKTAQPSTVVDVGKEWELQIGKYDVTMKPRAKRPTKPKTKAKVAKN